MLRRIAALALGISLSVAACGQDNSGTPPRTVGCPQGYCGRAPVCGQACADACGCCPCAAGVQAQIDDSPYTCTASGCFAPAGNGGTGGVGGAGGSAGAGTGGSAGGGCTGCANVPEVCGQGCPDPCGCCPCTPGTTMDIGGVPHGCDGAQSCFVPL